MTIMWEISVDPLQSYRCLKSIKINLMREQKKGEVETNHSKMTEIMVEIIS